MKKVLNILLPWKVILLFPILFFFTLSQSYALDITLQWNANTEPDLAGYRFYFDTNQGHPYYQLSVAGIEYSDDGGTTWSSIPTPPPIDVGTAVTEISLRNLDNNATHYFAVTAYDTEGFESNYSVEIDTKPPQITSPPTITSMTDTTVTIDWHTDEPSNSEVQYQATPTGGITWGNYLNKVTDPSMVTSHSVTLIGLSVETQYYFRVGSTDAGGVGPPGYTVPDNNPSIEYGFFINQGPDTNPPVITLPPTVTSITDRTAVIEWQTDEPSTSIVQYDNNSSTWGNYLWNNTDTSLVTTHSVTLTLLTPDTQYYFRVGSTDGFSNGPTTSNEVNFITDTTPDTAAPIITIPPTVTGITKTSAIIEWQTDEPSDSVVDYGVDTSYGYKSTLAAYVTNHSVTLSGLSPAIDYHFQVSSTDAFGNGPPLKVNTTNPSNDGIFKTKNIDDQAPVITSAPTVTNITNSTAVIEWQTDEPSNSQVQYQANSGNTWGSYGSSANNPAMVTTHSVTLTGLTSNMTYYFMVGSIDAYGNGPETSTTDNNPSAEDSFTTDTTPDTAAPVISSVIVLSTTDTTATITWQTDEPSNSMVQYGASSTWGNYSWSENDAGMVTSHSVTLTTGLTKGTVYYFSVGSTDASGNGPDLNSNATNPSPEDSFITDYTPDTEAPVITSPPTVTSITDTTAVIEWQTDEPSNSQVKYNTSQGNSWGSYPLSENDAGMVTSHSVTLTGLEALTSYYFSVGSTDASGNGPPLKVNISNPSAEDSFTTDTTPDTAAPVITSPPTVTSIRDTTAVIEWQTDELSNSMVQYGAISSTWGNYTWSRNDGKMATSHSVTLAGLTKGKIYHFRVGSNDALGNGPGLNPDPTNPSNDDTFTTTNTDTDPPSIIGFHIDYVNDAIDITYDEANMQNANIEANYSFSPNLYFRTAGGSDDITYRGSNTYRLFMAFIPENTGFTLTVAGITDQAGNEVDPASITIGIPSAAGDIKEVIPHNKAGIDDSTRVSNNTSFAVRIEDSDGIDTTDLASITFTINDGFLPTIYDYNLGNTYVVRVVQLDPTQSPLNVTKLWVVYDRSMDYTYGPVFEFDATVTISVDATDRNGNPMNQGTYSFKVETAAEHNIAITNLPPTTTIPDPPLPGLTTTSVDSGDLVGAQIIFDGNETVLPTFGPMNELSALISGVDAVGVPMNLQPPTVFDDPVNKPVKIFIPCPGHPYTSTLNVYRYTGTSWVLACDVSGNVQPGGEAWMVPGTRVNHDNGSPSTIEIQVYYFTGVLAGSPSNLVGRSTDDVAGGGCFIATAAYGSNMDKHVKILTEFRDKRLTTNSIGRSIVEGYYKFSPPVADYLHKHPFARAVVRYSLIPVTGIAYISLYIPPLALLFSFLFLLLTIICLMRYFVRSRINIS